MSIDGRWMIHAKTGSHASRLSAPALDPLLSHEDHLCWGFHNTEWSLQMQSSYPDARVFHLISLTPRIPVQIIPFTLLATSSLLVHTANIPCCTKSQAGFWQEQLHLCAGTLNTLLHSLFIGGNKVKSSPSALEGDPANFLESVSVTINSA